MTGSEPANAAIAIGIIDKNNTQGRYDPLIYSTNDTLKKIWEASYNAAFKKQNSKGEATFYIPGEDWKAEKKHYYDYYFAIKVKKNLIKEKIGELPITAGKTNYVYDTQTGKEAGGSGDAKSEAPTSEKESKHTKESFMEDIIDLLSLYVVDSNTIRDEILTGYELKGLNKEDLAILRSYIADENKGPTQELVEETFKWAQRIWTENRQPTDPPLDDNDKARINDLFAKNPPKVGFNDKEPPKTKLKASDGPKIDRKILGEEQQGPPGLFFYNWWAFKNETDIADLDKDGKNPRQLKKYNATYQEQQEKDKNIADANEKPHGERALAKYLDGGVTQTNTEFTNKPPHAPEVLVDYPYIGLGAAIAKRSDIERLFAGQSFPEGAISSEQQQRLYELIDKEDLRWKWDWQNKPAHEEDKELNLKGYVVSESLLKANEHIDYDGEKQISRELAAIIIKHVKEVCVEEATVNIKWENKTSKHTTDSQGSFSETGIPPNKEVAVTASKKGYSQATAKITLKEDEEQLILILKEKDEPKTKEFVITCAGHAEDHPAHQQPLYGPETIIKANKLKDGKMTFQLLNNTNEEAYLHCFITALDENVEKLNRNDFNAGVIHAHNKLGQADDTKSWNAESTYTYLEKDEEKRKDQPAAFLKATRLRKTLHGTTITYTINVNNEKRMGVYRFWAAISPYHLLFPMKEDYTFTQGDLDKFLLSSYDFNYYDILIEEDKHKKKEEKNEKKNAEIAIAEAPKLTQEAGSDATLGFAEAKEKEDISKMFRYVIGQPESALKGFDKANIDKLKLLLKAGVYSEHYDGKNDKSTLKTALLKNHKEQFGELVKALGLSVEIDGTFATAKKLKISDINNTFNLFMPSESTYTTTTA